MVFHAVLKSRSYTSILIELFVFQCVIGCVLVTLKGYIAQYYAIFLHKILFFKTGIKPGLFINVLS